MFDRRQCSYYFNMKLKKSQNCFPIIYSYSFLALSQTYLLKLEDMLVEVILKMLICIIDAELLEAVSAKVLKPKDVQHSNRVPFML